MAFSTSVLPSNAYFSVIPTTMRHVLALSCALLGSTLAAQPFNWQWASAVPGGEGTPPGMANDADGNTYLAGKFSFAVTFAPLAPLTGTDFDDGYVVKYDSEGQALWAVPLTGSGVDVCRGLSLDAENNVYVTGDFSGPALTIGPLTLTGNGNANIFVAKFTTDGEPVWARNFTDTNGLFETGRSIATNAAGESYVTGNYGGTMALPDAPTLTSCTNNTNMFLMKLDTDGNVLWNQSPACPDNPGYATWGDKVVLDPDGDLYVAGRFSSENCSVGDTVLVNGSSGSANILFARYAPDGTMQWVHGIGNVNDDVVRALATDAQGNCYLAINRNGDLELPELTVSASGSVGAYLIAILKCDREGHFLLGDRIGNSDANHSVFSITAMSDESFYVGGWFSYNCVIDGFYFPFVDFEHDHRAFLVRYNAASVAQQVVLIEGEQVCAFQSLSRDEAGNLYAVSTFRDTATIGDLPILDIPSSGMLLARSGDFSTGASAAVPEEASSSLYPNPSAGRVHIDALLPFDRVEVTDMQGSLLLDHSFTPRRAVDLELNARGTLLYTLWSKGHLLGKGRVVRE